MYDRRENAAAHDAFWSLVRAAHGGDLPEQLNRDMSPAETWAHPHLALGQICGLPLRSTFRARVAYVGSATYDIGAPPGHYLSVWVARAVDPRKSLSDFNDATLAINGTDSQSGWAGPVMAATSAGVRFGTLVETGAHVLSAAAVAGGRADIAGIDAVSWRGIRRYDDSAQGLEVIGFTPPTPGLAFVTAPGRDTARMFDALTAAIGDLSEGHRNTLGLTGIVRLPLDAYHAVPTPPIS